MSFLGSNKVIIFCFILLIFLQYHLWFEKGGIRDLLQLKKTLALQIQKNEIVKQHNAIILLEIERLQHNREAVEARARNELGMIKKGETFYQIVK